MKSTTKGLKPCSPHTWGLYFTMKKVKNYLQLLKEAHQRHPGDFSYSEGKKKFKSQKNSYVSVKGGIIDSEEAQFYGKEKNNKIINP
jgi:hypothetical protein